jgi:RNA polymerase sigma-70 factor (ECF subfamily)
LWTLLVRRVGREDARELLQEAWCSAWQRLPTLREPERLRSWLYSIALNRARDAARRRALHPRLQSLPTSERGAGAAPDPATLAAWSRAEARVESLESRERIRGALDELPARQREVVELRLLGELEPVEIAEVLGISAENARANLYQGLRKLRAALHDLSPFPNPPSPR